MTISSEIVKELREKTGAGMMDCKRALSESNGDMEAAIESLRKKGVATAEKKSVRVAADGLIGHDISADGKVATLVEVNCETDFVTKTEDFRGYVSRVTEIVRDRNPADLDGLLATTVDGKSVKDIQTDVVAKIGENINARRFARVEIGAGKKLAQYIHAGSKIGVVVVYNDPNAKLDDTTGREVAMHVAAMHPQYVNKSDVPESVIAKEKEIMLAQMGETKKPAEILEKILGGKINKFYTEICLSEQVYVRDPDGKSSVGGWLKKIDSAITIDSFVRFQVGEGIEKRKD
ncbi:MAG TPA: translation elongation factor Ts [bacterium]|nr:elongation factor Ts [Myxococcales bacterium]OQA58576.1 MAG: Elongation factor Ts [bacterium ADurb.Bin270]HPW45964.1 translation elongation factor Ts [bacterium]HQG13964.1 translation elongation factor Ts [bacterium]